MLIVESYTIAVAMCVITMLCWGSWANTQKLASSEWQFQLFYWDYSIGVLLLTLSFAFTIGSSGDEGRAFLPDISQAGSEALRSAFIGGVIFNIANILLVVAIDIAGMAVAFPGGDRPGAGDRCGDQLPGRPGGRCHDPVCRCRAGDGRDCRVCA
jgi:glucose uptake protein